MGEKMFPFPFEFAINNQDGKKLFLDTVEKVLVENLQSENSFGCKICNCHTHVGSERHLNDFIEAELLFHNSYYNKGFALITVEKVLQWLQIQTKIEQRENVLLVGYENFSELYLCETVDILNREGKGRIKAKYCIYENIGERADIRKLRELLEEGFLNDRTKVVFVISISTTFTTFQKLIIAFYKYLQNNEIPIPIKDNILNIALIVIAQEDEFYWRKNREADGVLELSDKLYQTLPQRKVYYFSFIKSTWYPLEKCPYCFPDLNQKKLIDEVPIFGINRASVVPMLQLENWRNKEPFSPEIINRSEADLKKVIRLSKYMYHGHLQRNGNHIQYYFDTESFFSNEKATIEEWLTNVVRKQLKEDLEKQRIEQIKKRHDERLRTYDHLILESGNQSLIMQFRDEENQRYFLKKDETSAERIVYDFLVAPRHYSNAGFVHVVNDFVFDGMARIFYFDVQREYRGNINAKYSDFQRYVFNIRNSRQYSLIRFHFVDDTIYSSGNFMRSQSLISTLTGVGDDYCEIQLYASVILLLGRNSKGTQKYLLNKENNFFEYVHLAISPMRNHEDACTLCLLGKNYEKIKEVSATNTISTACETTLGNHSLDVAQKIDIPFPVPNLDMRFRLIISHILTMHLSNQYILFKKDEPVNRESETQVYQVLEKMWINLPSALKKLMGNDTQEEKDFATKVKIAFIKVISRPFFSFHIRQKQAAFRFCLQIMEGLLIKEKEKAEDRLILEALLNGLTDMDANYLIRQNNMIKLLKKVNSESYYKSVKKLIALSQGDTKSLLLEATLTSGNEKTFFEERKEKWILDVTIKNWFSLYIENNQILINGFKKWNDIAQTVGENGYGISNFRRCFEWNGIINLEEQKCICTLYNDLVDLLPQKEMKSSYEPDFAKMESTINKLLDVKEAFMFVGDTEHHGIVEKEIDNYILLNDSRIGRDKLYKSSIQKKIDHILVESKASMKIGDSLIVPYFEQFYLIKISMYNKHEENNCEIKNQSDMVLYIYVPEIHDYILDEEMNMSSCYKTLQQKLPFLFRMKILMSLRNQFELLMKGYFGNITKLIRNEQMKKALSISKVTGHGASAVSQCLEIDKIIDVVTKRISEIDETGFRQKRMFDKYIQLLANNFISEIYRMIHTGELEEAEISEEIWRCSKQVFGEPEYMIFLYSYINAQSERPEYEFMAPRKSTGGEVKIIFRMHIKKNETWQLKYLHRYHASDSSNFKIIILLACNAAYHSVSNDEIVMDIYKEGDFLCFKNEWDMFKDGNDKKKVVEEQEKIYGQLEVHPSRRGEGAGISLWSLKRYCELLNPDKGGGESFKIEWENKKGKIYYIVKMILFGKE